MHVGKLFRPYEGVYDLLQYFIQSDTDSLRHIYTVFTLDSHLAVANVADGVAGRGTGAGTTKVSPGYVGEK